MSTPTIPPPAARRPICRYVLKEGSTNFDTVTYMHENVEMADFVHLPLDEYLAQNKEKEPNTVYHVLDEKDAYQQLYANQDRDYVKPWDEVSEDVYNYNLEVLPPEKWEKMDGVEIFRSCEYYDSNITRHTAGYDGRYFTALRRTTTEYPDIAREIKEFCMLMPQRDDTPLIPFKFPEDKTVAYWNPEKLCQKILSKVPGTMIAEQFELNVANVVLSDTHHEGYEACKLLEPYLKVGLPLDENEYDRMMTQAGEAVEEARSAMYDVDVD